MTADVSIIIPAHNEETTIGRCLTPLVPLVEQGLIEVVVGCNGCSDTTAATAARVSNQIKVMETHKRGKFEGLNLADSVAHGRTKIYLDADVSIGQQDLVRLIEGVNKGDCLVASPTLQVDLSHSSAVVKAFYRVWTSLPYFTNKSMIGTGLFALSPEGRTRFGKFPEIIADDGYVRSLFAPSERRTLDDCTFTVRAPSNVKGLIKIKTRAKLGKLQLFQRFPENRENNRDNTKGSILRLAFERPTLVPSILIYVAIQSITRIRAQRQFKKNLVTIWERDDSSRTLRD